MFSLLRRCQKMATCRHLHHVAEVSDGSLDASVELRDGTASSRENTPDANKAGFRALAPYIYMECRLSFAFCVLPIAHSLRRSTCDRRVFTSWTCLTTSGDSVMPTFTRWCPGSCPVVSAFSYIHPMGARLLPGGECLLHSPDGGPAPARWRVPSPTFTRWGPGSCPVASAFSYIHPMGARLLPGGECLLLHSPYGGPAPARWRVPSGRSTSCLLPPGSGRAAGCRLSRWHVRMLPRWHSASH